MQGPAHRQKIHAAEKHAPKIQHVENESVTFKNKSLERVNLVLDHDFLPTNYLG